jgi:hypothetical protein
MLERVTQYLFALITSSLLLFSCDNENAIDCFKSTGEKVTVEMGTEPFRVIEINDGMDIFLQDGPEEKIVVKGGKNLIPKIHVDFKNDTLILNNLNTCNWTRNYDKIEIYLTAPKFDGIIHHGFGNIKSIDTLKTDILKLRQIGSPGDVSLTVDNYWMHIISNSLGTIRLSGETNRLVVGYFFNDGLLFTENLDARDADITHSGYHTLRIRTKNSLAGEIVLNGTIEYYSEDAVVEVDIQANGKVVHLGQ